MLSLRAAPDAPELCGLLPFIVWSVNICLERCEYFYFVALAVGVDLCCHLIREQVKLTPGELHIGQRKHTCCEKSFILLHVKINIYPRMCKWHWPWHPGASGTWMMTQWRGSKPEHGWWLKDTNTGDRECYQHVRVSHLLGHQARHLAVISTFIIKTWRMRRLDFTQWTNAPCHINGWTSYFDGPVPGEWVPGRGYYLFRRIIFWPAFNSPIHHEIEINFVPE